MADDEEDILDDELELDESATISEEESAESDSAEPLEWIELWARRSNSAPPRLDQFIVARHGEVSRASIQRMIADGHVRVNGKPAKASYRVQEGDCVTLAMPRRRVMKHTPEDIPLDILHEDDDLVVLNKQANIIVHPGRGARNWSGTLTNALLFHFGSLSQAGGDVRPGIVHRLDRDTTGVLLVAKNDRVHQNLALQFERRKVVKEYLALTYGLPDRDSDYIEKPIGHHPNIREKMAIRDDPRFGKSAVTFYEVAEKFAGYGCIRLRPRTGRTHQIRVHLAHVGCPIIADQPYSGRKELRLSELKSLTAGEEDAVLIARQALHAHKLRFYHPTTRQVMDMTAPIPSDMAGTLEVLREFRGIRTGGS